MICKILNDRPISIVDVLIENLSELRCHTLKRSCKNSLILDEYLKEKKLTENNDGLQTNFIFYFHLSYNRWNGVKAAQIAVKISTCT